MSQGCQGKLENNLQIIDDCNTFKDGCITIYNDGKEKHDSWEARILFESYFNSSQIRIECTVYEDTRENALVQLQKDYNNLVHTFKEDYNISEPKIQNCANCMYYDDGRCRNEYSLFYQRFMYTDDYCSKCWSPNKNKDDMVLVSKEDTINGLMKGIKCES